jgi:uncharacterized membrane protein
MLAPRLADLETIYALGDESEVRETLAHYGANYLYIGPRERALYELDGPRLAQLEGWLEPAWVSGDVRLLRSPDTD